MKRSDKAPEVFVRARWPYFWVRVYRKLETLCFGSVTEYRPGKDHYEALTQPILNALGVGCLHGAAYAPIRKPPYGKNFFAWGYFQSLRYFEPFQAEIRRELSPRAPLSPAMEAMAEEIKSGQSVSVHIRRGDFFKPGSEIHQVCTAAYYQKAIREISQKIPRAKFYLFSDSPQWIWDNLNLKDVDFHLVEESHTALEDLRLMGCCKHFILSNSSFSWWAQYLAPGEDKIVVAPSRWYRDERETDVYQPDWIRIDP